MHVITPSDFEKEVNQDSESTERIKMIAIINRNSAFGTLDGVITKNEIIRNEINKHLKAGTAKKLVDTEDTLMYKLSSNV
jgi:hypothetical protein